MVSVSTPSTGRLQRDIQVLYGEWNTQGLYGEWNTQGLYGEWNR